VRRAGRGHAAAWLLALAGAITAPPAGAEPVDTFERAMLAYEQGRFDAALAGFLACAADGHLRATELAASMQWYGERLYGAGVPRDAAAARRLFARAAAAGSPMAAHMLGVMPPPRDGDDKRVP
jgi:TPR repeat protein